MPINEIHVDLSPKMSKVDVNSRKDVLAMSLQGDWSTAFKGRGIEFAGFRKYQYGDDASLIDWKASLRSKEILIREFEEYKNFTIFFLLDVSDSMLFSSHEKLKCEFAAELVYTLADAMNKAGDSVGLAMFNTEFVNKIAPFIGMEVMNNMKSNLLNKNNYGGGFDLKKTLLMTRSFLGGRAVIILVSDFIGLPPGWERYVQMMSQDFELVAIMIKDPRDRDLPDDSGQMMLKDPYTGENIYVDTSVVSELYKKDVLAQEEYVKSVFRRSRGDFLLLTTDNSDYVRDIMKFFQNRSKRAD
ncbi:MAG: DUF58 domain-containing protein [Candidatus Woesearchaeota archaeon]|jgi:uncharacterized protein (DUF58 family)